MALIIEDGTGIPNANSYVTYDEAVAYATLRGKESLFLIDDEVNIALIKAVDYLESISDYQGVTTYTDQVLLFPRSGVYINDIEFDKEAIPQQLKTAQIQLAIAIASGIDVMPNSDGSAVFIKKEKVGPLETEYESAVGASGSGQVSLPTVDALINVLLGYRSGFRTMRA